MKGLLYLLIKTKLIGKTRNCITDEHDTINKIIVALQGGIKGESTEVKTGKLMNLKQNNKTANDYVYELIKLTDSLKGAYISEGLNAAIADKYVTKQAMLKQ